MELVATVSINFMHDYGSSVYVASVRDDKLCGWNYRGHFDNWTQDDENLIDRHFNKFTERAERAMKKVNAFDLIKNAKCGYVELFSAKIGKHIRVTATLNLEIDEFDF